eukprot:SAG11_NODE_644_length_7980_cov_112.535963_2_plen_259_part_00
MWVCIDFQLGESCSLFLPAPTLSSIHKTRSEETLQAFVVSWRELFLRAVSPRFMPPDWASDRPLRDRSYERAQLHRLQAEQLTALARRAAPGDEPRGGGGGGAAELSQALPRLGLTIRAARGPADARFVAAEFCSALRAAGLAASLLDYVTNEDKKVEPDRVVEGEGGAGPEEGTGPGRDRGTSTGTGPGLLGRPTRLDAEFERQLLMVLHELPHGATGSDESARRGVDASGRMIWIAESASGARTLAQAATDGLVPC